MSSSPDVIKLFWPSHLCSPKTREGFIIGWYNTSTTICIASIVSGLELSEMQELMSEFCTAGGLAEFVHINKVCNVKPQILGVLVDDRNDSSTLPSMNQVVANNVWLKVTLDTTYVPIPLAAYLDNQKLDFKAYKIIFYEQPNPKRLQFLALSPLELDISSIDMSITKKSKSPTQKQLEELANLNTIIEYGHALNNESSKKSDDLDIVLVQINSSYFLESGMKLLTQSYKRKNAPRYSALNRIANFFNSAKDYFILTVFTSPRGFIGYYAKHIIVSIFMCALFFMLALAEVTLHALNVRLPKFVLNGVALKDLFAAGQQIDLRLQQLFFWPRQYMMLRKQNWANTAKTRAYYISFYNSMWLVANDIIIGLAFGSFLMANNAAMAKKLHYILHKYTVESLQSMMLWFLETPAGLKLNHELGSFLSELFLWLIRLWTLCTQTVEPYTPQIIHLIGLSGVFGVTMVIALSSDFLAFMTLHVYCFYMVAARIFNWQLVILNSLFNLFRGKKRNILRNRIDSCDYDLDQLLLGTSLFTLLMFLFPTVLIYYLTFALGRVAVIFLQAIMETVLAFFNHFPLFAIMLRFKDPHRLPGGLEFEIFHHDYFMLQYHGIFHRIKQLVKKLMPKKKEKTFQIYTRKATRQSIKKRSAIIHTTNTKKMKSTETMDTSHGAYLWMKNMPIPLGAIFFQYMLLWKKLSAHYFSAYVFKCLLHGEPIKPIRKLQYPMLPDTRPSLSALWQTVKTNLWDTRPKKE